MAPQEVVQLDDDSFATHFASGGRREPAVIKLDMPSCPDCIALDEFWGMAGANFPPGSICRCDCAASPRVCALVHSALGGRPGTAHPTIVAWDGRTFTRYEGPKDLQGLLTWLRARILQPDAPSLELSLIHI